ncbi:hypothetical protein ACOBQJ_09410 [Pelotomaculum propionicicum]|uniref:hypothetical protein n=1 Tax=Pelotomaculum propionicicum TaxID=258475 RepID=UPI003B78CAA9
MRFSGEYFIGVILIVLGVLLLVRHLFNLNIPVFRVLLGAIFILIGISIAFGGFRGKSTDIIFSSHNIEVAAPEREYNFIFSNGVVDFSKVPPPDNIQNVKVNTIFSDGTIIINPQTPVLIKTNAAFASANMPGGNSITFGNYNYKTKSVLPGSNYLEIEASVVFGKLSVIERP